MHLQPAWRRKNQARLNIRDFLGHHSNCRQLGSPVGALSDVFAAAYEREGIYVGGSVGGAIVLFALGGLFAGFARACSGLRRLKGGELGLPTVVIKPAFITDDSR